MSRSHRSTRPLLTLALTVFIMLAMLAPVAVAAPEWVHGVVITSPTADDPAFVQPDSSLEVGYTVAIVGTQVDDVWVRVRLQDKYNSVISEVQEIVDAPTLGTGPNDLTSSIYVPWWLASGWYDIVVCVMDYDWDMPPLFCDKVSSAVLVDDTSPWVELVKPAYGAWVTGQDYLMVGTAEDDWAFDGTDIVSVVFEYCVLSNWRAPEGWCGLTDEDWVWIADGVPTPGIPHQYEARWDTSQVPDDEGYVRICATNLVGLTACDWNLVYVQNRYTTSLRPGWNLISTPLVLYDEDIEDVLLHLIAHNSVKQVLTYDRPSGTWHKWTAPAGAPGDTLTKIEDGKGYWIEMAAAEDLTFVGTWSEGMPPTYRVYEDWNLIGYTQWGEPTWWCCNSAFDYLGFPLYQSVESFWRYDAWSEVWVQVYDWSSMVPGAGYWLAVSEDGTINP